MPKSGSMQGKRGRGRVKVTPDPRWIAFGKRIADHRRDRGWLAYEVAKMIDVDPATISQLENGRRATGPEQTTLIRLAELFGVSTESLMGSEAPRLDPHSGARPRREPEPDRTSEFTAEPAQERSLTPLESSQIRAALYDALLAFFADIFETVSESRARATEDNNREIRGRDASTEGQRARRH